MSMAKKSESVANCIEAVHYKMNKGAMRLSQRKLTWSIPDTLIDKIERGMICRVKTCYGVTNVLVCGLKHMEENDPEFPRCEVLKVVENV